MPTGHGALRAIFLAYRVIDEQPPKDTSTLVPELADAPLLVTTADNPSAAGTMLALGLLMLQVSLALAGTLLSVYVADWPTQILMGPLMVTGGYQVLV